MKSRFVLLLCLVLASVLLSGCGSTPPVKSGSVTTAATEATATPAKALSLKVGDTTSYDTGLKVTVLSVGKGPKDYKGKTTLKVQVNYVNAGTDTASFSTTDWKLQDSDGARTNDSPYFMKDVPELGYGELAPGGKKTGNLYFPAGKYVAVVYESNMFGGEEDLSSWSIN